MVKWEWKSTSNNTDSEMDYTGVELDRFYCTFIIARTGTMYSVHELFQQNYIMVNLHWISGMTQCQHSWHCTCTSGLMYKKKSSWCCPALSRCIILVMLHFILYLRLDWCTEVHSTVWHDPDPTLVTWLCWSGSAVWQRDSYTWTGNNNNLDIYW